MLTKADQYLVNDIHNILDNGYPDENLRPKYADGTPAHTISVNHVTRRYDLSKGEFPICTLRHQAWKTGIRAIFTIYRNPTNVLSEMREQGVTWWDPWDIGDGTIGQRYGATVRRYDLIHRLIEDIRKDPYGRRKIVDLWQEPDLRETPGLAPCAFLTIWNRKLLPILRGNRKFPVLRRRKRCIAIWEKNGRRWFLLKMTEADK